MWMLLATLGCDRQSAGGKSGTSRGSGPGTPEANTVVPAPPKSEFRFCPAETYNVAFVRDASILLHLDDSVWGFPLVSAVPALLEDAGLSRSRITRMESILVGKHTAFLFHSPDAVSVVDRVKARGLASRTVESDVIYGVAQQPEDPTEGAWGWVLLEPGVAGVGNMNALEEILHTARGRNENVEEARPELKRVLRTGRGCDTASYVLIPRGGLEVIDAIRKILEAIGMGTGVLEYLPKPTGMVLGGVRGKSRALAFMATDLGNVSLARMIVKWANVGIPVLRAGLPEEFPDIDKVEFDQEAGMVRALFEIRGTVWDANLTKMREKDKEWTAQAGSRAVLMSKARPLLAPGNRFEVTANVSNQVETVVVEVLQRAWNGERLDLRMLKSPGDGMILATNYGSIAAAKDADGSDIHVRINAGTSLEQALRIEGDRLVGRMVRAKGNVVWRPLSK